MKVLVSAIACNPSRGSEPFIGWNAVSALARQHELTVLTHARNRPEIEQRLKSPDPGWIKPPRFVYVGVIKNWSHNRLIAKFQAWKSYLAWGRHALKAAKLEIAREPFDLAHHITYATWRVGSPLWQLGLPFVWGPIGGAGNYPLRFFSLLSPGAVTLELARSLSSRLSRFLGAQGSAKSATRIVAANRETADLMIKLRGSTEGISTLSVTFFTAEQRARLLNLETAMPKGPLKIFGGGNIIGSKGVALALRALSKVMKSGVKFHYTVAGGGPEIGHLKRLVQRLGIGEKVTFVEMLKGDDYLKALAESHLYLLPSFRETSGITLLEAMLAECVPVVVDASAQGETVREAGGYAVSVSHPEATATELADVICLLDRDRKLLREKAQASRKYVVERHSREAYLETINRIYREAVAAQNEVGG